MFHHRVKIYSRAKNLQKLRLIIYFNNNANLEFPFDVGWTLKENLQLGNKGEEKQISKKVVQYLQDYFLMGNLRSADHYSHKAIHTCLENLVTEGELVSEEILTIKTIKSWIERYSKSFKKKVSEHVLIETNGVINNSNSSESITNKASKRQKTNLA
ncbi:hypothetical protein C1646_774580 [Rhizophagus diaphanus]|nr:hypothetical protein C1646_774580 [Rhizophagus diaphanus] [Rhizophagus sp. MUCL 43196]